MSEARRLYPSKRTDAEWAVLEPLLPPPAGRGRPTKWRRRATADAIFHLVQSGCAWRMLPQEFPPSGKARCHGMMSAQLTGQTVFSPFRRWRLDGTLHAAHERLREQGRLAAGRDVEPSAAIIDRQTVKCTSADGPERGYHGAKRTKGQKRHVAVDATGLLLLVCMHAADLHDRAGDARLAGGGATPP